MGKKVLALVENLFFAAKINEAAGGAGAEIEYARDNSRLLDLARADRPSLIILDLNAEGARPFEALTRLKADAELRDIPTLGFFAHVQVELLEQARRAGCDRVLPRSAFFRSLAEILA